jgi:phage terminase large subunit GpA-like protein
MTLPFQQKLPEGLAPAQAIVRSAFARGLKPSRRRSVAQWAAEARVVSPESGSRFPGRWSNELTPHLIEPMECCTLSHPSRHVTFKKCHQAGFSEVGLNLIGAIIEDEPAPILVVLPTTDEVKKYVKTKLQPMIDATPSVAARVREQKSRDEDGSTTTFKRFAGGFLQCTGANSSAGLQMITVRVVIREEVSEYPDDVDGRGDPAELAEKRATTWEGYEKIIDISTPAMKGACRISVRYELSDQRVLYLPCPQCGVYQPIKWERLDKDSADPIYPCAAHGCVIEHAGLRPMLRAAVWIKTYPGADANPKPPDTIAPEHLDQWRARVSAGRDPGFAFSALTSPFMSWAAIVKQWREAKGTPAKEKVFCQQVLGEAWEEKGESPDHERLFEKRVPYEWRRVPPGALFLTAGADVQGDRIEWGVYAWGPAFSSWLIDKGVIEGDPLNDLTWNGLNDLLERTWPDAYDRAWKLDALGVDSGYLSQSVYRWVRSRGVTGRVFALDGRHGWRLPALGTPQKKDVDHQGKKIGAVLLWPVGTWDLKSELYGALRKMLRGRDAMTGQLEPGIACYGDACDLVYLQQLTAEQLVVRKGRHGLAEQAWEVMVGRRNEAHDIAVYARALAHHLGDGMTAAQWLSLAASRGARPEDVQRDLASLWTAPAVQTIPPAPAPVQPQDRPGTDSQDNWLGDRAKNWLN